MLRLELAPHVYFLLRLQDMSSECKPPAISAMTKTQLLSECNRLGLVVHRTWTVEELKAVIQEHRMQAASKQPGHQMKAVTSLNMPELKMKATEMGVEFPDNITKGNLLRLIRDSLKTPGTELMKIGKYKGFEFQEIPSAYGEWASREVKSSANPHMELIRYAKWWDSEQMTRYTGDTTTIEEDSVVPYPGSESGASSVWGLVSDWGAPSQEMNTKAGRSSGYSYSGSRPVVPRANKRTNAMNNDGEMDTEHRRGDSGPGSKARSAQGQGEGREQGAPEVSEEGDGAERNPTPLRAVLPSGDASFPGDHRGGRLRDGPPDGDLPDLRDQPGRRLHDQDELHGAHGPGGDNLRPGDDEEPRGDYKHEGSHFGSETLVPRNGCCGRDDDVLQHDAFITAQEFSRALRHKCTNFACAPTTCTDEDPFAQALRDRDFSYGRLKQLLDGAQLKEVRTERGDIVNSIANYNTIGLFTHGGTYGITTRTKTQNYMTRYLNEFGRYHLGDAATWTSLTIAHNTELAIHHDYHNLQGSLNHVTAVGRHKVEDFGSRTKSSPRTRSTKRVCVGDVTREDGGYLDESPTPLRSSTPSTPSTSMLRSRGKVRDGASSTTPPATSSRSTTTSGTT